MILAQLKGICSRSDITVDELRIVVECLNQQRINFGTELHEIKPPAPCGWLPRSRPLSQEIISESLCKHYKEQIQQWITLIELHEASLTWGEKLKRFVGKHKWLYSISAMVIGGIGTILNGCDMIAQWFWPPH